MLQLRPLHAGPEQSQPSSERFSRRLKWSRDRVLSRVFFPGKSLACGRLARVSFSARLKPKSPRLSSTCSIFRLLYACGPAAVFVCSSTGRSLCFFLQGKGNKIMDQTFDTFMKELREEKGEEEDTVTGLCQKGISPNVRHQSSSSSSGALVCLACVSPECAIVGTFPRHDVRGRLVWCAWCA